VNKKKKQQLTLSLEEYPELGCFVSAGGSNTTDIL